MLTNNPFLSTHSSQDCELSTSGRHAVLTLESCYSLLQGREQAIKNPDDNSDFAALYNVAAFRLCVATLAQALHDLLRGVGHADHIDKVLAKATKVVDGNGDSEYVKEFMVRTLVKNFSR